MADEVEEGVSLAAPSPVVSISFQRNVRRKEKYLEAEPKALGITQIGLSVFQISSVIMFWATGLSHEPTDIPVCISSVLVIIAGSLAVAAQNLQLPLLRACLGMQIVATVASIFNGICTLFKMETPPYYCWRYYSDSPSHEEMCHKIEGTHSHFYAECVVIHVALLAISLTLTTYCCKVVNCCSPAPKMPVITLQVPPAQQ